MTDPQAPRPPNPPADGLSAGKTLLWVIGLAILFGMALERLSGVMIGGLLGYLVAQVLGLRGELGRLKTRLGQLETPAAAATTAPAEPARPRSETPVMPPPLPAATAAAAETPRADGARPTPPPGGAPRRPIPPATPSALELKLGQWRSAFVAWLKSGNPLARTGIVVLFFGGAFVAKYAAEHSLFPLELRLALLAAGAMVLLLIGWRLRERRRVYALTLQGGGVAILYLTVFTALRLYHLLTPGFALPLLVVVALSAAVLAVAQNALSLAVIGFTGGFLAPILASTGGGNHIALFSYYTVLNLGIFAIAWFRAWRVLNLVGFLFTFGIAGVFRTLSYRPEDLLSTDFFFILFFLMYVAVSVLFALRQPPKLRGYVSGSLVFGLPVAAFTLHASLVAKLPYGMAWSALAFGVFYAVLAWSLYLSRNPNLRLLTEAFAALAVVFASLAVPLAFDHQTTAAMWAVEGAGLLWIGCRQDRKLARGFGALLQLAAAGGYLLGLDSLNNAERALLNSAWFGSFLLALSGLACGLWLYRARAALAAYEKHWSVAAGLWGLAWWLYGGLAEMDRFLPRDYWLGGLLGFAAFTLLALQLAGTRLAWPQPGRMALVLLPLAVVGGLLEAAGPNHPFATWGGLGWPALLAVGYGLLWRQERAPDERFAPLAGWLHPGGLWSLALIAAWEIAWQLQQQVTGVWSDLAWGLVPALLLWNLGRARPWPAWPLARHAGLYRLRGALPVLLAGVLWLCGMNLSDPGDAGSLPYLPLLNPLDLASALFLLALASYWLGLPQDARAVLGVRSQRLLAVYGALIFLWLSAALLRALHHGLDLPWSWQAMSDSFLVQAALSVFWGVLGFGIILSASRMGQRALWLTGAGLMAVVVVKLFLVDLDGSGTLPRIVSFLTIGVLLLVTGYLSPLPPRATAQESGT